MVSAPHINRSPHGTVRYNHFHEYNDDNEELFEIREMTPEPILPVPTEVPVTPSRTRVAKLKQAITISILRKKSQRKGTAYDATEKRTTLPRTARDEHLRDLADEMYGRGKYYRQPERPQPYASVDPKPFVSATFPRRAKSVRWKTDQDIQHIQNVEFGASSQSGTSSCQTSAGNSGDENRAPDGGGHRRANPNWLQEFELPEPTLVNPLEKERERDTNDCFNLKDLLSPGNKSPSCCEPELVPSGTHSSSRPPKPTACEDQSTDTDPEQISSHSGSSSELPRAATCEDGISREPQPGETPAEASNVQHPSPAKSTAWQCECGGSACTKASVHTLTEQGVRSTLGHDVADSIAKELLFRVGPPPPLPPRDPNRPELESPVIRQKEVIENYATWAAVCLFQKLVLSIKLSLERFKPMHRGVISFDFSDYTVFNTLDLKARYLVTMEMYDVFNEIVGVLHDIRPDDMEFRKRIMGTRFWAQGQSYRMTPTGLYSGVLLDYRIKRGGDTNANPLASGLRATI